MIKQLREQQGFTSQKAFASVIEIPLNRYQLIERMLVKATEEEFERMGGKNYDEYLVEIGCGQVLMYTNRLVGFARACGCDNPEEVVRDFVLRMGV